MDLHQYLDLSGYARVFVVGDIHGEADQLAAALKAVGFNEHTDILVSVGDLTDRGPKNLTVLQYLTKPWFYRVRGNHEYFAQEVAEGRLKDTDFARWGGSWFTVLPKDVQVKLAKVMNNAPVALTIKTPGGNTIGVTHGDCQDDWTRQTAQLNAGLRAAIFTVLESREYRKRDDYDKTLRLPGSVIEQDEFIVRGIDHVFHGHTPIDEITCRGNRTWIDTGACFQGGHLTMLDVDQYLSSLN